MEINATKAIKKSFLRCFDKKIIKGTINPKKMASLMPLAVISRVWVFRYSNITGRINAMRIEKMMSSIQ
jgi:hypothetical protein